MVSVTEADTPLLSAVFAVIFTFPAFLKLTLPVLLTVTVNTASYQLKAAAPANALQKFSRTSSDTAAARVRNYQWALCVSRQTVPAFTAAGPAVLYRLPCSITAGPAVLFVLINTLR